MTTLFIDLLLDLIIPARDVGIAINDEDRQEIRIGADCWLNQKPASKTGFCHMIDSVDRSLVFERPGDSPLEIGRMCPGRDSRYHLPDNVKQKDPPVDGS
jgi:hypothetical protein